VEDGASQLGERSPNPCTFKTDEGVQLVMPRAARLRRRPDILMVGLRTYGRGQGGIEAHVEQLAKGLDDAAFAVEVVVRTPYSGKGETTHGRSIRVVPIWSPRGRSTEAIIHTLISIFYAAWRRPRVVHIHAVGPSLTIPIARALGLRIVFTHHGEDYNREKWGWFARKALRLGEFFGAHLAHERICVSPSLAKELSSKYDVLFRYIPNGVKDLVAPASSDILKALGLERRRYILHVGRIVPEKRQSDIIEAISELEIPDVKVVLVGSPDHESEYSRLITAQAVKFPNVVLAGFQSGPALAELYSNAALFVLPSSHEGLPIALLEAMAYGCHVIASDITANLNLGLPRACYFPVASIKDLADKINAVLTHEGKSQVVDWSRLLESFNWDDIATRTIEVYQGAARHLIQEHATG